MWWNTDLIKLYSDYETSFRVTYSTNVYNEFADHNETHILKCSPICRSVPENKLSFACVADFEQIQYTGPALNFVQLIYFDLADYSESHLWT